MRGSNLQSWVSRFSPVAKSYAPPYRHLPSTLADDPQYFPSTTPTLIVLNCVYADCANVLPNMLEPKIRRIDDREIAL